MAFGSTMVPLNLQLIEEGQFLRDADYELRRLASAMAAHVDQHGDAAKKAKGKLTMTVEFSVDRVKGGVFAVESSISLKLPGRPNDVTAAVATTDRVTGELTLCVRDSGSTPGDPTQCHLSYPKAPEEAPQRPGNGAATE